MSNSVFKVYYHWTNIGLENAAYIVMHLFTLCVLQVQDAHYSSFKNLINSVAIINYIAPSYRVYSRHLLTFPVNPPTLTEIPACCP
jgi:hypothetical protein